MPARLLAVARLVGDAFPGSWFEEAWAGCALPLSSRSPREPLLCHTQSWSSDSCGPWVETWGYGCKVRCGVLFGAGSTRVVAGGAVRYGAKTLLGELGLVPWPAPDPYTEKNLERTPCLLSIHLPLVFC